MMNKRFLSESDIDYLEKRLRKMFVTKIEFQQYRSESLSKLFEILGEIKASREEQTLIAHQVSSHKDRLNSLEEVAPGR